MAYLQSYLLKLPKKRTTREKQQQQSRPQKEKKQNEYKHTPTWAHKNVISTPSSHPRFLSTTNVAYMQRISKWMDKVAYDFIQLDADKGGNKEYLHCRVYPMMSSIAFLYRFFKDLVHMLKQQRQRFIEGSASTIMHSCPSIKHHEKCQEILYNFGSHNCFN